MRRSSPRQLLGVLAVAVATAGAPLVARASIPPPPNQAPFDEVQLQNGGFVRGEIEEIEPGSHVVLIKHNGGAKQRFEWKEIESVVRTDGTVIGKDAKPQPKPKDDEPKDDEPKDDEPKDDEPKDDEPKDDEPKDDEPKDDEPKDDEPKADEPKADEPTPAGPQIELSIAGSGPPVELRDSSAEALCTGECELPLPAEEGDYRVTIGGRQVGKSFQLPAGGHVDVKHASPVLKWTGVALIPATIIAGVGVGLIPVIHNVPRASMIGYAAGGAAIGVLGIAGGVTLILFSRAKVKVLPGLAPAPSTPSPL